MKVFWRVSTGNVCWAEILLKLWKLELVENALPLFYFSGVVSKSYTTEEYLHPQPDKNTKIVNIAIINIDSAISHVLYIKDVEKATGYRICPKYDCAIINTISSKKTKHEGTSSNYSKHIKNCAGKTPKEMTLKVKETPLPYVPHIYGNETYKYLLSHEKKMNLNQNDTSSHLILRQSKRNSNKKSVNLLG
jgi:hypothetical protein